MPDTNFPATADSPLVQDSNYRFTPADRQYIDKQILALQAFALDGAGNVLANGSTGTLNNVATTSSGVTYGAIRFSGVAPTVTGLASGAAGRRLVLMATGGDLIVADQDGGSLAANQVVTGTGDDVTVPDGSGLLLIYDAVSSRWRVVGGSGGGGGGTVGGTDGQLLFNNVGVEDGTANVTYASGGLVINASGFCSFGTTPATGGFLRFQNVAAARFRNQDDSDDVSIWETDSSNQLWIGTDTAQTSTKQALGIFLFAQNVTYLGVGSTAYLSMSSSTIRMDNSVSLVTASSGCASTGKFRLRNADEIYWRNSGGSGDIEGIYVSGTDELTFGSPSYNSILRGVIAKVQVGFSTVGWFEKSNTNDYLAFGAASASTGNLRMSRPNTITWRNTGGTGDLPVLQVLTGDVISIGDPDLCDLQCWNSTASFWGKSGGLIFYGADATGIEVARTTAKQWKQTAGQRVNVVEKTADYTLTASDFCIVVTVTGKTMTLPASPSNGDSYEIKNIATTCTVDGNGHNIDGTATVTLNQYDSILIRYTSTTGIWVII